MSLRGMPLLFLAVSLPLYLMDQLSKWLVLARIAEGDSITVIPGVFYLVRVYNTGAAFGMLKGANTFFITLSFLALVVVAVLAFRGVFRDRHSRWAAAMLVGGVAGNLTDRLVHGHVIDFLDVVLPLYGHWPAFNVADSGICIAAGLFLLAGLLDARASGCKSNAPEPSQRSLPPDASGERR